MAFFGRIQCTRCKAVFTVLPHFVLRYRKMRPNVARDALLATHGGLSLKLCAAICHLSPMALYRLVIACATPSTSSPTSCPAFSPAAQALRSTFHAVLHRYRQRISLRG